MSSLSLLLLAVTPVVTVDGRSTNVGPVLEGLDGYIVAIDQMAPAMTRGDVEFRRDGPATCSLRLKGKILVRMPYEASDGEPAKSRFAEVFDPPGSPTPIRTVTLADIPHDEVDDRGRTFRGFDVETLGGLLGVTVDLDGGKINVMTPALWAEMLDLPEDAISSLGTNPLSLVPDFGISPPAKVMTMWVRPPIPSDVQLYRLTDGIPRRMLGRNPVTGRKVTLGPDDLPEPFAATSQLPARAETEHLKIGDGRFGLYAAILSRKPLETEDPVAAIRSGNLKPGDYAVVGLRQRIEPSPVVFEDTITKANETPFLLAKRLKNDVRLLMVLNGLEGSEPIPTGTRVVYVGRMRTLRTASRSYKSVGPYVVRGTESLESLAKLWGVKPEQILEANPELSEDGELEIGALLERIAPLTASAPKADLAAVRGTATAGRDTDLFQTNTPSGPVRAKIDEGQSVEVLGKTIDGKMLYVKAESDLGFVVAGHLTLDRPLQAAKKEQVIEPAKTSAPKPNGRLHPALQVAFQHLGTRYKWGGASLTSGIDCSHFVSAAFSKAGLRCPPPPVLNQERDPIVHYKAPNMAVRYRGRTVKTPARATPLASLTPGDRVILQYRLSDAPKTRHTGIYAGRIRVRGRIYENAVVHASCSRGITIDDLTTSWLWKDYKYSVRSASPSVASR
jgi:cell wall-associated NlpC family hydrolase